VLGSQFVFPPPPRLRRTSPKRFARRRAGSVLCSQFWRLRWLHAPTPDQPTARSDLKPTCRGT